MTEPPRTHPEIDKLAPFEEALYEQRAELFERFRAERRQAIERAAGEPMDEGDRGIDENQASEVGMWSERHQRALIDIDDALARIASGEYGFCERCGEPIELRRLQASPAARRCIFCESLTEDETDPRRRPTL